MSKCHGFMAKCPDAAKPTEPSDKPRYCKKCYDEKLEYELACDIEITSAKAHRNL